MIEPMGVKGQLPKGVQIALKKYFTVEELREISQDHGLTPNYAYNLIKGVYPMSDKCFELYKYLSKEAIRRAQDNIKQLEKKFK